MDSLESDMQMKLGFIGNNDLASVEADSKFAKEHGFEGIEYNHWGSFRELTADYVGQMRAIHEKHGVRASMLGLWGWNHLSPKSSEREEAHLMLGRLIDFAKILGADTIVTGTGHIPGEPVGRSVAEFAKVFAPFFEKINKAGLKVAFYAVHGGTFLESIEACERAWEVVPELKLKYDPANWQYHGADYLELARRYAHKFGYIHIKEHLNMGGKLVSQPAAGMGDIEWGKLFAFLYERDYRGWLSVEPHGEMWGQGAMRDKMLLLTKRYISQFMI